MSALDQAISKDVELRARAKIAARRRVQERVQTRTTFLRTYRNHPLAFVKDCFDWDERNPGPTFYQEEILDAFRYNPRIAVSGPHGLGKTTLASWLMIWFIVTRDGEDDWIMPTTAGSWRQLSHFLWPEMRNKWVGRVRWDKTGREPFNPKTELFQLKYKGTTGEAYAAASTQAGLIEGAHADSLFYLFDEAKSIPPAIFDGSEGAFSGAGRYTGREAFAGAFSTPGLTEGRFYEIQMHGTRFRKIYEFKDLPPLAPGVVLPPGAQGDEPRTGTMLDQKGPFALVAGAGEKGEAFSDWWARSVTFEETVRAGRNDPDWARLRAKQWGAQSSIYKNRVLGIFSSDATDTIIPLSWVEAAQARWDPRGTIDSDGESDSLRYTPPGPVTAYGCDPGGGVDKSIIAPRHTFWIGQLIVYDDIDPTQLSNHLATMTALRPIKIVVDEIGIGAGVISNLRAAQRRVVPFHAGKSTRATDASGTLSFLNKRAHAWWLMRELLDPASACPVALPPDDLLAGDLSTPKWDARTGKIRVESKDDIRARLGRSTDAGDAVVMAFYADQDVEIDMAGLIVPTITRPSRWQHV